MGRYDLSHITEVVKSGWTGDMYITEMDAYRAGFDSIVAIAGEDFHAELTALIASWDCKETENGGVLVYTKPVSKEGG